MLKMSISLDDIDSVIDEYNRVADRCEDIGPILSRWAYMVLGEAQDRIMDQGGDLGWPPAKSFLDHPLLYFTGALYRSLDEVTTGQNSVEFGTDSPYAAYQQKGTAERPGRGRTRTKEGSLRSKSGWYKAQRSVTQGIPPRPFLIVTEEDEMKLKQMTSDYITMGVIYDA